MLIIISLIVSSGVVFAQNLSNEFVTQEIFLDDSLSNVFINIPQEYVTISPGSDVLTSIKIMNLGNTKRMDVVLDFEILDAFGDAILTKKETVAIETQANFIRIFEIPKTAEDGKYKVHVTLIYANGQKATADASFEIVNKIKEVSRIIYTMLVVFAILALGSLIILKSRKMMGRIILRFEIKRIIRRKLKMNK
ncbi:MAG: hypothetical protein WC758_01635 [Candidatus Woesearchaeota archaeon]|jgi:uncharacterized membrane protein